MATHERLGNLSDPAKTSICTSSEFINGSRVITTRVVIKSRHNSFRDITSDVLELVWEFYKL